MTLTFNGCLVAEIPPTRMKELWTSLTRGHEEEVLCLLSHLSPLLRGGLSAAVCAFWKGCKYILVTGGPRTPVVSQGQVQNSAVEWVRTCVVYLV